MSSVRLPLEDVIKVVRGRKVGVLTNSLVWLEDAGDDLAGVLRAVARETVLLYGEHGSHGDEGAARPRTKLIDEYTSCRMENLYGQQHDSKKKGAIGDMDVLVVGVHEIGCRHYSYKRTMCHLMQAAAEAGKPVWVVDLPNPVRGDIVEGNYPDLAFYTKDAKGAVPYGWFAAPIAYRHGMTIGELALMARDHLRLNLDLHIVKMEGWRRNMWWEDTGWPYVSFDPSIYTAETTHGFLCTGLLQGTSVAWGIGTADPFRAIGAPWVKDDRLLHALRKRNLAGVTWSRAHFIPRWHDGKLWGRFAGEQCHGVRLHFTDRNAVCTAEVQLSLLVEFHRAFPEQFVMLEEDRTFDWRLEDRQWARRIRNGEGVESILAEWKAMSRQFEEIRRPYLLY